MTNAAAGAILIREFLPGDEGAFRVLNEEWIREYFTLEPKDIEALSDPGGAILDRGGRIFFAVRGGETVACCALVARGGGECEVSKMAVTKACRGLGLGRRLLEAVIEKARAAGVRRLFLESNRKLTPAISLYESVGFREVPAERAVASPYARSDIAMELFLSEASD